jgi:hypothetical protein
MTAITNPRTGKTTYTHNFMSRNDVKKMYGAHPHKNNLTKAHNNHRKSKGFHAIGSFNFV